MNNVKVWIRILSAACLMLVITEPFALSLTRPQQQPFPSGQQQVLPPQSHQTMEADHMSLVSVTQSTPAEITYPDSPSPSVEQTTIKAADIGSSKISLEQQQDKEPLPLGTAAAPYEKTTGIAASRPVGAAIAPARQRRARSFLIRAGIVVGVAIAVGTVIALSESSPSHP